jgi:uncharacterized protein YndB with AHSA1/START domain
MTEQRPKTRSQEHEIEIDAPVEAVWRAITDPDEIVRWFCENARVTPGTGGTFWVSWGQGQEGECAIEVWEPNKRVRLRQLPHDSVSGSPYNTETAALSPIINEYILESVGDKTVLRVVHSGILASEDWDAYYDGTIRGWQLFTIGLRHYLEKHPATPRDNLMLMYPIAGSLTDAWQKLTGPSGLGLGEATSGPDSLVTANRMRNLPRYQAVSSSGESLSGEVVLWMPPKTLVITVEQLNNALLSATFEEMGDTTFFYATLATFGLSEKEFESVKQRWSDWLAKLLVA